MSLDRFHVMAGIFGVFSVPGQVIPASRHVDLLELDTLAMLADTWGKIREALATGALTGTAVPGSGEVLAGLDPEEILGMPGVESFLALRRIRDEAASGQWSRVVVDTSGATDPFELFRVPQMVADTIERLWPRHRRLGAATDNTRIARVVAVLDALIGIVPTSMTFCSTPPVSAPIWWSGRTTTGCSPRVATRPCCR